MRKDEERSHRLIDGWGEGVVIREPMGKDKGEITVGQIGGGVLRTGVSHRETVKGARAESRDI